MDKNFVGLVDADKELNRYKAVKREIIQVMVKHDLTLSETYNYLNLIENDIKLFVNSAPLKEYAQSEQLYELQ